MEQKNKITSFPFDGIEPQEFGRTQAYENYCYYSSNIDYHAKRKFFLNDRRKIMSNQPSDDLVLLNVKDDKSIN